MNRHKVSIQDGVPRDVVARRIYDPRLESKHPAIPVDGRRDVGDGENGVRSLPLHTHYAPDCEGAAPRRRTRPRQKRDRNAPNPARAKVEGSGTELAPVGGPVSS